ncbi:MAG TPA: F0F1 ATP synthase subunit delta [Candidatus Saccharimonadales bacterium]|nr:F0F1 ATP synthase subunit delta [Candidatus Saccharimonadales bacterium]
MEQLRLPSAVVSPSDIARMMRELNGLDDFFVDAETRKAGTTVKLPKLTRSLDQLARDNGINLLQEAERSKLMESLKTVSRQAPNLHISFAVEPSPKSLEKILIWMRRNIHPQTLLSVGLQPAIAAGCVLRTPNKVFDMSLRNALNRQTSYLSQLIKGAADGS